MDMLPEGEQTLVYEFVKRIILAWDPDFTKATPFEKARMEKAEQEFSHGEYVTFDEIDWEAD